MKKILFHLNCLEKGGAERVVTNLSGQFVQKGYDVIIATEWTGEDEYEIDSRVRRVHVGLTDGQEKHGRLAKYWDRVINLRKTIIEEKPDVVIAFARKANYRALTATIGTKFPVVISVRINPVGWYDKPFDKIQIPLLFPRAAGAVFQTPAQAAFFPGYIQRKSRVILNPLSEKFIGKDKPTLDKKIVVHSGRLVDFKNQKMLIESFVIVHKTHPDYLLKIYGPDSGDGTKEILEKTITDNNAGEYVRLMGPSDTLEDDLREGAVAAYSSDYEGMPNAVLEAMALGLPVVSTDCPPGGPSMVIESGMNGILVPVGDCVSMAKAINQLIEDKELAKRLGENATMLGVKASPGAICNQWEEYLMEVISR